jgi:3-hydroxyisobutyrate dehydrogenase-like beta-hydroxyacid dehydrogenase
MTSLPSVGFIGAGQMGMPMVRRLHAAGIALTVLARRPEVLAELTALGIASTGDAQELAASADIVEICLFSDHQLEEVMLEGGVAAAMRPGSLLVNHVTGSPRVYDVLAMAAPAVHLLDAPVSGTAAQIAQGDLTVLLGGTDDDVQRATPVLSSFASHLVHVGALGDGQRVKLVNNLMFTVNLRLAGEAVRIGESLGISREGLVRGMAHCSGRTWALALLEAHPYDLIEQSARKFLEKDVAVVEAVAAEAGIDLGLPLRVLNES